MMVVSLMSSDNVNISTIPMHCISVFTAVYFICLFELWLFIICSLVLKKNRLLVLILIETSTALQQDTGILIMNTLAMTMLMFLKSSHTHC